MLLLVIGKYGRRHRKFSNLKLPDNLKPEWSLSFPTTILILKKNNGPCSWGVNRFTRKGYLVSGERYTLIQERRWRISKGATANKRLKELELGAGERSVRGERKHEISSALKVRLDISFWALAFFYNWYILEWEVNLNKLLALILLPVILQSHNESQYHPR